MNRVIFLIDGFNLYHSIRDIEHDFGVCVKWLNIHSLLSSYLHNIGNHAILQGVFYFSALAKHLKNPTVIERHNTYLKCLKVSGVIYELATFKAKNIACPHCQRQFTRHEEKETDVALAAKLFEVFKENKCDTDLRPAVRTAQRIFPNKKIIFAFPYKRDHFDLSRLAPNSFKIRMNKYITHQFPDPFPLPDGTTISKPSGW